MMLILLRMGIPKNSRMKSFTIVCVLALAALACADTYTDRYNNVNVDEILSNRRLLLPFIKCVLDQGKCSPEGKELKSHIREALENNCAKCDPKQREGARKVIAHMVNHEPGYWNQLMDKYDPEQQHRNEHKHHGHGKRKNA
ncbi:insect pheromone-binding family, a10/OS-D domain-containing protein [Phthorimaea operculella]|nr:insect pheromone-binding family, a10/OS-D domain-containing protein [Phthorimaea operculella]